MRKDVIDSHQLSYPGDLIICTYRIPKQCCDVVPFVIPRVKSCTRSLEKLQLRAISTSTPALALSHPETV